MKEEDWLNSIMTQADSLPQARMRDGFEQEMLEKVKQTPVYIGLVTKKVAWLAAASVALLLAANISAVNRSTQESRNNKYEELANTYGMADESQTFNMEYNE
jgi:hypothetical protein